MLWPNGTSGNLLSAIEIEQLKVLHIHAWSPSAKPGNDATPDDWLAMLDSTTFNSIEALAIEGYATTEFYNSLCNHSNFKKIKYIFMPVNGVQSLANSNAIWESLKAVNFGYSLSSEDLQTILDTPKFSQLDWLGGTIRFGDKRRQIAAKHNLSFAFNNVPCLVWP